MARKETRISRRGFLKAGGAGLAAVSLAPLFPRQPAALAAPERRLRTATKEIRVLVIDDPVSFALDKVINDFTAVTGIKANVEHLEYNALNARLITSFISQTPDADVVAVDQIWAGQYLDNRWVIPLDKYIQGDSDVDIADFIPEVLYSLNTWRGHVVTLPIAAYGQGVMYNKDAFEKAGLQPPPSDPGNAAGWTWAKYMETVKALQGMDRGGTKMFGTVICGAQPDAVVDMYTQLAASHGVRWFKKFPEAPWDFEPTINSPENLESLKYFVELYKLSPAEAINYFWFDAGTRFGKGDIGMFYWWTPYFYLVKSDSYMSAKPSAIVDKIGYGVLPTLNATTPQVISNGGYSLGIPSSSANQDEGWQFIKWVASAATQKKMALVPDWNYQFSDFARASLYQDVELKKIYPYLDVQLKILRMGNGKIVRPLMPLFTTLGGIYGLELNKLLAGAVTPEACLKETDTLFRNALAGNMMMPYKLASYDDTLENTQKLIASLAPKK